MHIRAYFSKEPQAYVIGRCLSIRPAASIVSLSSSIVEDAHSIFSVINLPLGSRRLAKNMTIADHNNILSTTKRLQRKRRQQQQQRPPKIQFIPPAGNEPPAEPENFLASIQADLFLFENDNERYVPLESGVDVDLVNYDPFHCKAHTIA